MSSQSNGRGIGQGVVYYLLLLPIKVCIAVLDVAVRTVLICCFFVLLFGIAPPVRFIFWLLQRLQASTGWRIPGLPPPPEKGFIHFYVSLFSIDRELPADLQVDNQPRYLSNISTAYEYQPLGNLDGEPFKIRILELLPASDLCSPIQIKLHHVSIEGSDFEALSYCWGESTDTWPIYLDQSVVHARINLVQAFQQFRLQDKSRFLWADAICIDQSSPTERSEQVAMMSRIYQMSKCTLIWLGCGSPSAVKGLEYVKDILDIKARLANDEVAMAAPSLALLPEDRSNYKLPGVQHPALRAFLTLQSNPWFTRIWIIQEVAMSSKSTITMGSCSVDWDDFFNAREFASKLGILTLYVDDTCNGPFAINMARAIISNKHNLGPQQQRLLPLFLRHRKFGATDARDKIFGLFGLFPPSKYTHPLLLVPNYEWSIVEIYSKVAKCVIDQDGTLDILTVPRTHSPAATAFLDKALEFPGWAFSDPPRLPSWVPSWYTDDNVVSLQPAQLWYEYGEFRASRGTKYEIRLSSDHSLLGVEGLSIGGDITALGSIWPDNPKIQYLLENKHLDAWEVAMENQKLDIKHCQHHLDTFKNWQEIARLDRVESYPGTDETYYEALWQTILAGHFSQEKDYLRSSFNAWLRNMQNFESRRFLWSLIPTYALIVLRIHQILILGILFWPLQRFEPFIIRWTSAVTADPDGVPFLSGTVLAVGRRIVRLSEGWIGLVPGDTEVGDKIFLLKGGKMPVVLRRKGENWEVVGEAYVHGIMKGELWDEERCEAMWLE